MPNTDLYDELGVSPDASKEEVDVAYRKAAIMRHPDRYSGDIEGFKRATEAYEVLSNDERRRRYDEDGKTEREPQNRIESKIASMTLPAFSQDGKDAIGWMNETLDRERASAKRAKQEGLKLRREIERKLSRFESTNMDSSNRDGFACISGALRCKVREIDQMTEAAQSEVDFLTDCMTFLNGLSCPIDRPNPFEMKFDFRSGTFNATAQDRQWRIGGH